MNSLILSILVAAEIFIAILGLYTILRKNRLRVSLSFCYATILVLAIFSCSIQVFFLLNLEKYFFLFDMAVSSFFFFQIIKEREELRRTFQGMIRFMAAYRFYMITLSLILGYLFLQAFLLPPVNFDSMVYNLARVLMFQNDGTMFLSNFTSEAQIVFPVGFDILSFLFLRFYSDFGLGLFSFMSYISIAVGTYALVSEMYQNKNLGVKTAFIVASFTELILQATSTKNDIPGAALTVVCFLSAYSFINTKRSLHLYVTLIACMWGVSVKGYFPGLVLPFALLFIWLLLKEMPVSEITKAIFQKRNLNVSLLLPVGLLVCLAVFYGNNLRKFGGFFGSKTYVQHHQNQDGLEGSVLNATRYLLQSADFPKLIMQNSLNKIHKTAFGPDNRAGAANKEIPVDLSGKPAISEDYSWYGPLGFLLAIPSILICCFSRRHFLRLVSLSLLGFVLVLSYKVAWTPWTTRFFALFFAGSGVCIAFLINQIFKSKWIHSLILGISFLTLFNAALFNQGKPAIQGDNAGPTKYLYKTAQRLFKGKPALRPVYFPWVSHVADRDFFYKKYFGEVAFTQFSKFIEKDQDVLLTGRYNWIFPFLFTRPDLNFTVAKPHMITVDGRIYNMNKPANFRFLKEKFDYILIVGEQPPDLMLHSYLENEQAIIISSGTEKKHLSLYRTK